MKIKTRKMTPADLKYYVSQTQTDSHFFDRPSMQFFGDTMANYGVRSQPVKVTTYSGDTIDCWELYRRRPVKHGLSSSAFFAVDDYRRVLPAKD